MTGCSSGLIGLIFLLRRDADILHTIRIPLYWGTPVNVISMPVNVSWYA